MSNNNRSMISDEKKCPGKAIYSELNYDKLRSNRLKELDTYYKKVLQKYEDNKRAYDSQFSNIAQQANNATADLTTKTATNATNDDKQEAEAVIKPTVINVPLKI